MEQRIFILSERSGLCYMGPHAADTWSDEPGKALQFASAKEAWRFAKRLEKEQAEFLEGEPVEIEGYDPKEKRTARLIATDATYTVLRAYWKRTFGEPLPLDIPERPGHPDVARAWLIDYLGSVDWQRVRAREGDSFGFDRSFWEEADKLFQANRAHFDRLWSSVVPPDIPPPDLSKPRWRAALAGAEGEEQPNEVERTGPSAKAAAAAEKGEKPPEDVPAYVGRHFVQSGSAFYYKQRPDVLAFSTRGQSFRAHDNSVMAATAIVEMAQKRGWSGIRVRGTKDFRRAVWAAAMERGLNVTGYSPTRGETALLAQSASPDGHPPRSSRGSGKTDTARSREPSFTGEILDMGTAPYRHEQANSTSFFVTLRDAAGQAHTHWGVGLKKAIEAAGVTPGQSVALRRLGTEPVAVDRPVLDANGAVSYKETQVVKRSVWDVRVLENPRDAARSTTDTHRARGASADPALAKALALIEARMPGLSPALRQELHRHFDAAYARMREPARGDARAQDTPAKSFTRSARTR